MTGDRAVSTTVSFALIIAITLLLVTGLVVGTEGLLSNQRQDVTRQQLGTLGEQLASTVATVAELGDVEAAPADSGVTRDFPARVAGSQYRIGVATIDASTGRYLLYLDAVGTEVNATVPVRVESADLDPTTRVNGGEIRVVYDPTSDEVRIENA